jgi:excisionase family DNA binding protein
MLSNSINAEGVLCDGLMTVMEAAEYLRVGRTTIYMLMEKGDLPYTKIGNSRRLPRRTLVEYAASRLVNRDCGVHSPI